MGSMLKLLGSLGGSFVAELKHKLRAVAVRGAFGIVGLVVLLAGLGFLLAAADIWLAGLYGPVIAASIVGGALLVLAIILFLLASRPIEPAPKQRPAPADMFSQVGSGFAGLGRSAAEGEGSAIQNPAVLAAGFALLAGFMMGRRGGPRGD